MESEDGLIEDSDGFLYSGDDDGSDDFACLPDGDQGGDTNEMDFYENEGTTEKWTPQEASARMKSFIHDYKLIHGENSIGHIDQVTTNIIQLVLNPILFLNKKERHIWGVRPNHSIVVTVTTNSFFELPEKLDLKVAQTNTSFFLLGQLGCYQLPLNSLLSRRIVEDMKQFLKNYSSSESWRKTVNSETDDVYPQNVLVHLTDHFVMKTTQLLKTGHCVICGFIKSGNLTHNIMQLNPHAAQGINRTLPVPQVLHSHCWEKFYEWYDPFELTENSPQVADLILFLTNGLQTYNIYQDQIPLPESIPAHIRPSFQITVPVGSTHPIIPWNYAPQRVALFPEVHKITKNIFEKSDPGNGQNPNQYHYNNYYKSLMELDRALFSYWMYLPSTISQDEKTIHPNIWQQYSICCNSNDELKLFAQKKAEMGSYFAFMMLDFSGIVQLRNGVSEGIANPWIQPTRGIHLAKDTEKFKPAVLHAHNPYGVTPWVNSRNKIKPGFWKVGQNLNQMNNPFGITNGNYNVPFFLCEVLNNPAFINEEDDAKKGWILCNSRDDVVPLFLLFLNDHLKVEDIESKTINVIESQHWEERINGMWNVVRWLVMGSRSLTWVIEYHSVLQGLPVDLVLTVCNTMINSGLV